MDTLLQREEFRARRRRAAYWEYGSLAFAVLPILALLFLPEWLGRKDLFPSLKGKAGAIPYALGLLWMFFFIFLSKTGWRWFGLRCPNCGQPFFDDLKFELAMTTGRCSGCEQMLVIDSSTSESRGHHRFGLAGEQRSDVLLSRQEFADLYRITNRRHRLLTILAFLPAFAYVGPLIFTKQSIFRALGQPFDDALGVAMVVVSFSLLFYVDRTVWKKARLTCGTCGHKFMRQSFEITMTSGRCGGCGAKVLTNEPSSAV